MSPGTSFKRKGKGGDHLKSGTFHPFTLWRGKLFRSFTGDRGVVNLGFR